MRKLALALLLCSFAARAWEPATPADVQSRIDELRKAWEGKSPAEVARDKLARAKQARPAWIDRKAWKLELGPVTYYFAVGRAPVATDTQDPGAPGSAAAGQSGGPPASARPLDWYFDEGAGVFYTLVVDAR